MKCQQNNREGWPEKEYPEGEGRGDTTKEEMKTRFLRGQYHYYLVCLGGFIYAAAASLRSFVADLGGKEVLEGA